ncbi:MAG: PLDc N-terminal domain-containing protein [Firmicutes bacterium]|nr:PLDc N-terminal domain-containing protein [Bacillota bacterium]
MPIPEDLIPLLIPLIVLEVVLMMIALIDLKKKTEVRFDNKLIWIFIIILGTFFGSIGYLIFGGKRDDDSSID